MGGEAFSSAARGSGSLLPSAPGPRRSVGSCVLPLLSEPQTRGQGQGWGPGRAMGPKPPLTSLSLPSLLSLRAPRTAASCNLGPARPGEGGGCLLPPHLMPTPALHLVGGGLKPKKIPLWFFLLCFVFFFLREVIFYSGFILKKNTSKKKKSIYVNLPLLFPTAYLP